MLAKWYKANGIKKKKRNNETWNWEECDTDDEDGVYQVMD